MHMVEMSKNMSLSATASKQGEGLLPKQYYRIVESSSQATHEEKDSEDNNKKCPHVWSLGGSQTSLHLSSSVVEKSIHSTNENFDYLQFNRDSVLKQKSAAIISNN
eukprot:COSAG06_NODE_34330_length_476_cov_0.870027_1_plen_105_part_01